MSSIQESASASPSARARRKKWAIGIFQLAVTGLVLAFVARQITSTLGELRQNGVDWRQVRGEWLLLSALCYLASLFPAALFWRACLVALGNSPGRFRALRAFLVGGVGKYVPGKAAVVFLRTVLVAGPRCSAASAGVAVFLETLTMMGVGCFLSAIVVLILFREHWMVAALAAVMAVVVLAPTIPRVTRQIAVILRLQRLSGDILTRLDRFGAAIVPRGWLLESANWLLQALAVWICLFALPQSFFPTAEAFTAARQFREAFPLMLVSTAISTVIGFLLLIPAGLGVREIVVSSMLAPVIGLPAATTVSVLSRLVMIFVDVLLAAALYPIPSRDLPPTDAPASSAAAT